MNKGMPTWMRGLLSKIMTLLVILAALLTSSKSYSQPSMTLDECLKMAKDQAPALMQARRNYEIASENAEAARRSLRSRVDLLLDAPIYTDNTAPVYNPVTGTTDLLRQRQTQVGGGLSLTQPIYWTGGSVSVFGNMFRRWQETPSGSSVNDYFGIGSIEIDQPLFKVNELKLSERESEMNLDLAYSSYISQWASLQFDIKRLFYNLYQSEREVQIQKDEVTTSTSNFELATNKFKAGLIAEVDAMQLEVDLASAQTDLFDRQRRLLSAERDLLASLGMPLDGHISAKLDSVAEVTVIVSAREAIQQALANRADIRAAKYDIDRGNIARDRLGNTRSINAALVGSFGASNNSEEVDLLVAHPYVNRGLTLSINIPIYDWGAHGLRMDAAEASTELSRITLRVKERQVEQEVRSVLEQLEAAKKQAEVAKKSVRVAQKAYELSLARFDAGKITSQDLALAQQRLTKARLSSLSAQVAEQLALADLTQQTLFDFSTNRKVEIGN
jgi:outer membrane protein